MHTTNYRDTLITMSGDCPVTVATPPTKEETVAGRQFALLSAAPYAMTSDQLLLAVENDRKGAVTAEAFFAKPQACLRASPLVKKHGYGLHHDSGGRVALVAVESPDYARLLADASVVKRPGMRSARG
nr:DUF6157 family protein [uncultured Roseococcus sp.]